MKSMSTGGHGGGGDSGGGGGSSWPSASSPLPTLPSSLVYTNNKKANAKAADTDCKQKENTLLQLTTAETCLKEW